MVRADRRQAFKSSPPAHLGRWAVAGAAISPEGKAPPPRVCAWRDSRLRLEPCGQRLLDRHVANSRVYERVGVLAMIPTAVDKGAGTRAGQSRALGQRVGDLPLVRPQLCELPGHAVSFACAACASHPAEALPPRPVLAPCEEDAACSTSSRTQDAAGLPVINRRLDHEDGYIERNRL